MGRAGMSLFTDWGKREEKEQSGGRCRRAFPSRDYVAVKSRLAHTMVQRMGSSILLAHRQNFLHGQEDCRWHVQFASLAQSSGSLPTRSPIHRLCEAIWVDRCSHDSLTTLIEPCRGLLYQRPATVSM